MLALERQARRDRARGRQRREYVEALQGADDEREAKELLRRRAERLVPGADAVVLTRNASGNSLDAATDPAAVPGLADALIDATPRTCLAIRRGATHEREARQRAAAGAASCATASTAVRSACPSSSAARSSARCS